MTEEKESKTSGDETGEKTGAPDAVALSALLATIDARVPFGPGFFMNQLRAFVRDRCPDPTEALPAVEITLDAGEVIDVCHVIGLAPLWVAVAARDPRAPGEHPMRTELIRNRTAKGVVTTQSAAAHAPGSSSSIAFAG